VKEFCKLDALLIFFVLKINLAKMLIFIKINDMLEMLNNIFAI